MKMVHIHAYRGLATACDLCGFGLPNRFRRVAHERTAPRTNRPWQPFGLISVRRTSIVRDSKAPRDDQRPLTAAGIRYTLGRDAAHHQEETAL